MIPTICPQYIEAKENFYEAAPIIARQGYFVGYYAFELHADVAAGVERTCACLRNTGLFPTGFRVPVDISEPELDFEAALLALRTDIETAVACGYRKALTWVMPGSNTLPETAYRAMLVRRLQELCALLARYGVTLGVELVAPYTLQQSYRYPAPCRMEDLFSLLAAADCVNLGIILDSFHFYCAGHGADEYTLITRANQVVMAHISDGVLGRGPKQQLDLERRLPGETGVIDCRPMLRHLVSLGYRGAVIAEPLDQRLASLPFEKSLDYTAQAVSRVWPE